MDVRKAAEEKEIKQRKMKANNEALTAQIEMRKTFFEKEQYKERLPGCTNGGPKQADIEIEKKWKNDKKSNMATALTR